MVKIKFEDGKYFLDSQPITLASGNYDEYFKCFKELPAICETGENGETRYRPVPWVHLHVHTENSLLDGAIKIKELAKVIGNGGSDYSPASAITDHGNVFGTVDFSDTFTGGYTTSDKYSASMKPIIGCEVYVQALGTTENEKKNNHLILLCKNEIGKKNLFNLLTNAEENFYKHANITFDMLTECHEGLICLTACLGGEFSKYLKNGAINAAREFIESYQDLFGDDFYIEIQRHSLPEEMIVEPLQRRLAKEYGVKLVATADSHYLMEEDREAHDILLCIGTKKLLSDSDRFKMTGTGYHYLKNDEAYKLFEDVPEAISTQFEILEKCNFAFSKVEITMPRFETPNDMDEYDYLESLARDGLKDRFFEGFPDGQDQIYKDRLEYELSVIKPMGFAGYFLIVRDFIMYAKNNGIAIGPGRGSAVGSLVSYAVGITDVDPLPYGLLFERFLNPERVTMPDIDVDIADDRRNEVLNYVRLRYGPRHVSRIITFGTLAARAALRNVGRVLNVNLEKMDKLAKLVPQEVKMTLTKAYNSVTEMSEMINADAELKKVYEIALRLEGLKRNKSQHACGVIIAKDVVSYTVPEIIMEDNEGNPARTACFTMNEIENLGLLKMDFLGLRNMSIIENAKTELKLTNKDLDLYDPEVYADIANGKTSAIFQIESGGMTSLVKQMFADAINKNKNLTDEDARVAFGKECFERMIAAIAIFRPGPMESIPAYLAGMNNPNKIVYDCPELRPILSTTYGCILYQEQVQQICRDLAGYSLGRADIIRRAMAKKKDYLMNAEKEIFIHGNDAAFNSGKDKLHVPGCVKNGISEEAANIIWGKMAAFAAYAFNKSHATGYAVITVQTAFLKVYNPITFWTETLNSVIGDTKKIKKYINFARLDNIPISKPSIKCATGRYTHGIDGIRIGLSGLRDCGKAINDLLEKLKTEEFTSLSEFLVKTNPNKKIISALAYTGALECFNLNRSTIIHGLDTICNYKKELTDATTPLDFQELDEMVAKTYKLELPEFAEYRKEVLLNREYEYSGMYLSGHPLDVYEPLLNEIQHNNSYEFSVDADDEDGMEKLISSSGQKVTFIGVIKNLEKRITKNGKAMNMFDLEDYSGSVRVLSFENSNSDGVNVEENEIVVLSGEMKADERGVTIFARNISSVKTYKFGVSKTLCCLLDPLTAHTIASTISQFSSKNGCNVCFRVIDKDGNKHTYAYSLSEKKLVRVGKNSGRPLNACDNLKIDLNFDKFCSIRELVRDIKIIDTPEIHIFHDLHLPSKVS